MGRGWLLPLAEQNGIYSDMPDLWIRELCAQACTYVSGFVPLSLCRFGTLRKHASMRHIWSSSFPSIIVCNEAYWLSMGIFILRTWEPNCYCWLRNVCMLPDNWPTLLVSCFICSSKADIREPVLHSIAAFSICANVFCMFCSLVDCICAIWADVKVWAGVWLGLVPTDQLPDSATDLCCLGPQLFFMGVAICFKVLVDAMTELSLLVLAAFNGLLWEIRTSPCAMVKTQWDGCYVACADLKIPSLDWPCGCPGLAGHRQSLNTFWSPTLVVPMEGAPLCSPLLLCHLNS